MDQSSKSICSTCSLSCCSTCKARVRRITAVQMLLVAASKQQWTEVQNRILWGTMQDNNKKHNIRPSICAWGLPWCVLGIFHSLLICSCPYIHTLYAMLWHVSCSCRLIFCSISCCVSHQYAL